MRRIAKLLVDLTWSKSVHMVGSSLHFKKAILKCYSIKPKMYNYGLQKKNFIGSKSLWGYNSNEEKIWNDNKVEDGENGVNSNHQWRGQEQGWEQGTCSPSRDSLIPGLVQEKYSRGNREKNWKHGWGWGSPTWTHPVNISINPSMNNTSTQRLTHVRRATHLNFFPCDWQQKQM